MTLTVTVEPSFLALTTTPSMAPSAAEVTCPVRAAPALLSAAAGSAWKKMTAEPSVKMDNRCRVRIDLSLSVSMVLLGHGSMILVQRGHGTVDDGSNLLCSRLKARLIRIPAGDDHSWLAILRRLSPLPRLAAHHHPSSTHNTKLRVIVLPGLERLHRNAAAGAGRATQAPAPPDSSAMRSPPLPAPCPQRVDRNEYRRA